MTAERARDHAPIDPHALAVKYQSLWRNDAPPELAQFVGDEQITDPAALFEVARVDLIERARAGELRLVESYTEQFPAIGDRDEWIIELLDAELCCRARWFDAPSLDDFARRFPQYADDLADLFDLLAVDPERSREATSSGAARSGAARNGHPIRTAPDEVTRTTEETLADETESQAAPQGEQYELLEALGEGGMGIVFKARQPGLNRIVAIKRMHFAGRPSSAARMRFQLEAETASRLQHPHIVRVIDVGEMDGEPFLAMEFIEGESLGNRIQDGPLDAKDAVALGIKLAGAVDYAHTRGVLHRDLKPANVLIDTNGEPHITDFGLAKFLGRRSELTQTEQALGTPSYMPPEQARYDHAAVGAGSDVYSLGATLFAMLTGRPPFKAMTPHETLLLVEKEDAPAPSKLNSRIDRDLDTIVLKCLEKEPARRFTAAADLADELERWARREPIRSRPITRVERLWRFCKRRPAVAAAIGLLLLLAVGSTAMAVRERRHGLALQDERNTTVQAAAIAQASRFHLSHVLADLQIKQRDYSEAKLQLLNGKIGTVSSRSVALPSRDTEYLETLIDRRLPRRISTLADGFWPIVCAALNDNKRWLVTGEAGGRLLVWDLETDQVVHRLLEGRPRFVEGPMKSLRMDAHYLLYRDKFADGMLTWEPCASDAEWIPGSDTSFVMASLNGQALRFDLAAQHSGDQQRELFRADEPLFAVGIAPGNGDEDANLLFGGEEGGLYLCDVDGANRERREPVKSSVSVIRFCEGADCWLVGYENGEVYGFDRATLDTLFQLQIEGPVWSLAVGAEEKVYKRNELGTLVAAAGQSARVAAFWVMHESRDTEDAGFAELPIEAGKRLGFSAATFNADGRELIALNDQHQWVAWQWPFDTHAMVHELAADDPDRNAVFAKILSEGRFSEIPLPLRRPASDILQRNDGRELLVVNEGRSLSRWTLPKSAKDVARPLKTSLGGDARIRFSAASAHVLWAAIRDGKQAGQLHAIDIAADRRIDRTIAHPDGCSELIARRDGSVVTAGADGAIRIWKLSEDGKKIQRLKSPFKKHEAPLLSLAISPDERWVAAVDRNARLRIHEWPGGDLVHVRDMSDGNPGGSSSFSGSLAFSADGRYLCAAGHGQRCPVIDVEGGFRDLSISLHVAADGAVDVAWSPANPHVVVGVDNGKRVAAIAMSEQWKWLEADFRANVKHKGNVRSLTPTPDDQRLVMLDESGELVFLEAHTLLESYRIQHPRRFAGHIAFHPTRRSWAWSSADGELEMWELDEPVSRPAVEAADATAEWTSREIDEPARGTMQLSERAVQLDPLGRLCMLAVQGDDQNYGNVSPLYFVRLEPRGRQTSERLEVDGTISDRRVSTEAIALRFQSNGEPLAIYRRVTQKETAYDGELIVARRMPDGDWTYQIIEPRGNLGFYPHPTFDERGELQDILHYTYAGFYLERSVRGEGGSWTTLPIGRQGVGLRYFMQIDADGRRHLMSTSHRFNADHHGSVYATWTGDGEDWQDEVISTRYDVLPGLGLKPDGTPVVRSREKLLSRVGGEWRDECEMTTGLDWLSAQSFHYAPDGTLFACGYDPTERRVVLMRRAKDVNASPTYQAISTLEPKENSPNIIVLLPATDSESARSVLPLVPRILVGRIGEAEGGWMKILEPAP